MSAHIGRRLHRVVVSVLALLSVAFIGASRLATPIGLADPVHVPGVSAAEGQVSGFIDIPVSGPTRVGFISAGSARLIVDGAIVAEADSGGETFSIHAIPPGAHRLHLQFPADEQPALRWRRSERVSERVPRAVLSPRRLSPTMWRLRRSFKPVALTFALVWMAVLVWALLDALRVWLARRIEDAEHRRAIWLLAVGCFALYAYPVWWGLPAGWAQDEVVPLGVEGLLAFSSPGAFEKYPPLLTYAMAAFQSPILVASSLGLLAVDDELIYAIMRGTGRLLSAGMAATAVGAIYFCVRRAVSHRVGLWAAALAGLSVPLAYYGKTTNPDVAYVFWFALALVAYQSALLDGRVRSYIAFGAAAACSVTTKDQAYGLFVLPILHLIWTRVGQVRAGGAGVRALARDAALPGAFAAGGLTFAAVYALPRNWSGLVGHFGIITGLASQGYRMVDSASLSGQAWLLRRTLHQIGWSFGWPAAALVAFGVAVALRSARTTWRPLLPFVVPAISYYVTFIAVVGYTYDRFAIPFCFLLAVFGGVGVERLRALVVERSRPVALRLLRAAMAVLVLYTFARALSVDMLMASDSRLDARRYLLASLPAGATVCHVEDRESMPFLGGFTAVRTFSPSCDAVVVTSQFTERYPPGSAGHTWYEELLRGDLGFRVAFQYRARLPLSILQYESEMRNPDPSFSVLHKVNPLITVLRPARPPRG
ncbi:MAG: ArnT family glycosyltransferase [Vicinamibacterales bacterium]